MGIRSKQRAVCLYLQQTTKLTQKQIKLFVDVLFLAKHCSVVFNRHGQPQFVLDGIVYALDVFAKQVCLNKRSLCPLYFHIVKCYFIRTRRDIKAFRRDVSWKR